MNSMNNNNILLDFGIPTCKTESVKDIVINVSARNDSFFNNFRISKEFSEKILDYYKQALEVPKYEKSNALSVLTNVIHIKKFEPVQLVEEDFWNADPYKNRSWQWGHHNWAGIWPLAQAAYIDNDKTSLEKLFERIEQWANIAMTEPTSQEMLWHDHSTALRLDKIVSLIALFANSISINQLKILKKLLICHAIILSHEDFYSKHTNHGYDQVLAMYQATHPSIIDGLEKLNRLAYRRLIDEIKFAFTEEGVHKENSPNYHRGMISNLIRGRKILNVLPCIDKGESLNFLDTILDKSLYFLACIAQPDSRIPIIGDSENSLLSKKLSQLSFYNNYKHYLFSATNGQEGEGVSSFNVYPKSGYAVIRKKTSESEENPREDFHLIFKCGMLSRYHRHDDDLNILLYAYGEHWLIDSGMYNHQQKDPIRIYMRSPLAHNIPVVNGVNTIRDPSKAKENWGIYECYQTKEYKIVKAKTGMYNGLNIFREIRVDQKNNILIKDIIIQKDLPKRPVWLFHVPSDKTITKQSNGVNILGKSQILNLEIMQDNLRTVEIYSGFNTMHPSVVSKKQGVLDDSYVVVIEPFDHNVLEFSFYFSAG